MKKVLLSLGLVTSALFSYGQVTITKYLPSVAPGSSQQRAPNGTPSHTAFRSHFIIPASEISGILSGSQFSEIAFVLLGGASVPFSGNMSIYLENTTDAQNLKSNDWATAIGPMTQVYNGSYSVPAGNVPSEIGLTLTQAFTYTGGGLYVGIDYLGSVFSGALDPATYRCNSVLSGALYMAVSGTTTPPATLNQVSAFRPQLRFTYPNPNSNDASVENIDVNKAHLAKIGEPLTSVKAYIRNSGSDTLSNLPLSLNISGANTLSQVQTLASLAPGLTDTVIFSGLSFLNDGTQTLTVSAPNDDVAQNNSYTVLQYVSCDTLAYSHNGSANDDIGFNTGAGILAVRFTSGPDLFPVVKGVNVRISTASSTQNKVVAGVLLDKQGAIIALSAPDTMQSGDLGKMVFFPFSSLPVIAPNDTFYAGLRQYPSAQGYFPVGTQYPALVPADRVYSFGFNGDSISTYNNLGTLIIEAILGSSVQLNDNTANGSVCEGQSVNWTATPGFNSYDFVVNGNSAQQSAANTYTATPTASSSIQVSAVYQNCPVQSVTDSVYVVPVPHTQLAATICEGETYILGSQVLNSTGTYSETFAGAGALCDSVVNLTLTVNMVNEGLSQNSTELSANAQNAAYVWIDCSSGLAVPGETARTFNPVQNGSYAVIVTENGCSDTSACAEVTLTPVGLNENEALQALALYPNPATESINLQLTGIQIREVRISDINGRVLYTKNTGSEIISIPVEQLRPGVYLVQVHTDAGTAVRRFIKH